MCLQIIVTKCYVMPIENIGFEIKCVECMSIIFWRTLVLYWGQFKHISAFAISTSSRKIFLLMKCFFFFCDC